MPHRASVERLTDILQALERIRVYVDGLTFEEFCNDTRTVEAAQFNFIVIGEAARHIPDDVTEQHPEIPWPEMRGLRNVVAHGYFTVSLAILWRTITDDLPPLVAPLQALVGEHRPG